MTYDAQHTSKSLAKRNQLHGAARKWIAQFKRRYLQRDAASGRISKVTMYFDPTLHRHLAHNTFIGLGVAWYLVPQDEALARELYLAAVAQAGWRDRSKPAVGNVLMFAILGLLLAQEFGDAAVADYLRQGIEAVAEPRHFGAGGSEFGYFFHLGERFPRGQLSALLMCAEVLAPGQWRSIFRSNGRRRRRSRDVTVQGVEFPALGICRAENASAGTGERMTLTVDTYVGMKARAGSATSFHVTNLPLCSGDDAAKVAAKAAASSGSDHGGGVVRSGVSVECDGRPFNAWRVVGDRRIEIATTIAAHHFVVNYRVPQQSKDDARL